VKLPFFVLHGEADTVTDPEVSRALYERANSSDKTMKLYPGMWHGLTAGEPDDNVEAVFSDIVAWLNQRSYNWASYRACDTVVGPQNGGPISSASDKRSQKRFLCGLKGRRQHHSAM
jgi:acylglycerol lipase